MSTKIKCLVKQSIVIDNAGNKVLQPALCETSTKGLLETFLFNRNVRAVGITDMRQSIIRIGICRYPVVAQVGKKYFIVDGQHLTASLEQGDLSVRFLLVKLDSVEAAMDYMITLNNTARQWSLSEFINSWSFFNEDYAMLKKYKEMYNLTPATIAALVSDTNISLAKKLVKTGQLRIIDKAQANAKMLAITNFFNQTGLKIGARGIEGLICYMGNIGIDTYYREEKTFINQIKMARFNNPDLKSFTSWQEYTDLFTKWRKVVAAKKN